jgi:hypothetical protein
MFIIYKILKYNITCKVYNMSSKRNSIQGIKSFPTSSKKITGPQGIQGLQGIQGPKRITRDIVIPTYNNNNDIEHTYDGSVIMIIPSNITDITLNLTIEDVVDNTMYEQDVLFDGDNVQNTMIASIIINGGQPIQLLYPTSIYYPNNLTLPPHQVMSTLITQKIKLYRINSIWKYALDTTNLYSYPIN